MTEENLSKEEKELIVKELKFVLNYREDDASSNEMALREDYVNSIKSVIDKLEGRH